MCVHALHCAGSESLAECLTGESLQISSGAGCARGLARQGAEYDLPPLLVERGQPTLLAMSLIYSKNLYSRSHFCFALDM